MMYALPRSPRPIPTTAIQIDERCAFIASSITSAINQADVPAITIGSVCLTRRAYFVGSEGSLVD